MALLCKVRSLNIEPRRSNAQAAATVKTKKPNTFYFDFEEIPLFRSGPSTCLSSGKNWRVSHVAGPTNIELLDLDAVCKIWLEELFILVTYTII